MSWDFFNRITGDHPYEGAAAPPSAGVPNPGNGIPVGPIPAPPPPAPVDPVDPVDDGFGPQPEWTDDPNAGTPTDADPASDEAPTEPPADAASDEGTPTGDATPDEGAPTEGDEPTEGTDTGDEGSDTGSSSDEDEGGADQDISLAAPVDITLSPMYAILNEKGKIVMPKGPGDYYLSLMEALRQFVHKEGLIISDEQIKLWVMKDLKWLEDEIKVHRRTAGEFAPNDKGELDFLRECDPETTKVVLAAYDRHQAEFNESKNSTLEDDLRNALAELAKVNYGKFNNIARMMHVKSSKNGKKLTPDDFLRQMKDPDDRKALLELLRESLKAYKASNSNPAPTT